LLWVKETEEHGKEKSGEDLTGKLVHKSLIRNLATKRARRLKRVNKSLIFVDR